MGGKSSKPELKRSKSFSQFGRSSQRDLFQKSKLRLKEINKKLNVCNESVYDEIKTQLESIQTDLSNVSQALKNKNKKKYDDVVKYFDETFSNFQDKLSEASDEVNEVEETPQPISVNKQTVELKLVRVASVEDLDLDEDVEVRKPHLPVPEDLRQSNFDRPASPKVKFGVQVMPLNSRISQEILKHRTLPANETPRAEFLNIRRSSESVVNDMKNHQGSFTKINELYNQPLELNQKTYNHSASFVQEENHQINPKTYSLPSSPSFGKNQPQFVPKQLEKRLVNASALQTIEFIAQDIDYLERKLKYFHGRKEYKEVKERFIRCLIRLDNVEAHGDSVIKQERKILINRTQELLKILDCLVDQHEEDQEYENAEKYGYVYVGSPEDDISAQGKPITATAL